MINFSEDLQDKVQGYVTDWVGVGSGIAEPVQTIDDHLHDVELDEFPFVVVNVRTAEQAQRGEVGSSYDLYMWTVHIYYLDMAETHAIGRSKRKNILGILEKKFEENRRLGNLESVSEDGHREYVYDSSISAILFDSSGQEEYYSFISELYLNVYTARS